MLSDTQNYVQSMLVTRGFCAIHLDSIFTDIASSVEANPLAESGDLSKGCFVRLESYQSFTIKNQRYVCEITFFFGYYKLTDSFLP